MSANKERVRNSVTVTMIRGGLWASLSGMQSSNINRYQVMQYFLQSLVEITLLDLTYNVKVSTILFSKYKQKNSKT